MRTSLQSLRLSLSRVTVPVMTARSVVFVNVPLILNVTCHSPAWSR